MNLNKELETLKTCIGVDEAKFKEHFTRIYAACTSEEDKNAVRDFIKKAMAEKSKEVDASLNAITVRMQLSDNIELLPLSYIAKNYFRKSRQWLYQRVNANKVHGKPAAFTKEELSTFNFALSDIGKRIGSLAIA